MCSSDLEEAVGLHLVREHEIPRRTSLTATLALAGEAYVRARIDSGTDVDRKLSLLANGAAPRARGARRCRDPSPTEAGRKYTDFGNVRLSDIRFFRVGRSGT